MNNLYLENGYLNFDYILERGAWLNVIIGKRQVGKTYGCLQLMLRRNFKFILLRRTTAELETIAANMDLNPFEAFKPDFKTGLFKSGKDLCKISDYETDENSKAKETNSRGIATSLAQIAHIRGFNGSAFSDLVYDEFIPEKGVITRATEGDSFLNAYRTINGNRELNELPPLRAWLLANSNRIDSPVLEALNLTDDILYMRRRGLEELKTANGTFICQPNSEVITKMQKETALAKQISKESDFYKMALENEFAYDASPYIKTLSIKGMRPVWNYNDVIYCWTSGGGSYYICRAPFSKGAKYGGGRVEREKLANDWSILKPCYYAGLVLFSDLRAQALFKSIYKIT